MKKISLIFICTLISNLSFAQVNTKKPDLSKALFCDNKNMIGVAIDEGAKTIDRIVVQKATRKLYLMNKLDIVRQYNIAMGPAFDQGAKSFRGDNKTPEGIYSIEYKNPASKYYLSLKVSYPNAADKKYANLNQKDPGGDIMIHGIPVAPVAGLDPIFIRKAHPKLNWTQGCMAVTDREIEEIFSFVEVGTEIEICPI